MVKIYGRGRWGLGEQEVWTSLFPYIYLSDVYERGRLWNVYYSNTSGNKNIDFFSIIPLLCNIILHEETEDIVGFHKRLQAKC
jgi:hypothetical protein